MENEDVDKIIKEELMKDEDHTVLRKTGKGFERVEVTQTMKDSPDPRVHGAKIIFDSRLDEFSSLNDKETYLSELGSEPHYPKLTLKDKKEALFGKNPARDEEFESEPSRTSFKRNRDAEADSGEQETHDESVRNLQQKLINFKRVLVELGIPVEFCDHLLQKYQSYLSDDKTTENDVDAFLEYLKYNIIRLKFETEKKVKVYKPIEEYTIDYLYNVSKTNNLLNQAKEELNPRFNSMHECVLTLIEEEANSLGRKLKEKCDKKYEPQKAFEGLLRLEDEYQSYIKGSVRPDLAEQE